MATKKSKNADQAGAALFNELSQLIEQSQYQLASYANSTLTMLFWQFGKRINEDILQNKRADYGKQIVVTLSRQLEEKHGKNFEEKNLRRMMQFADIFNNPEIVVTLSRKLSWSHFLALLPLKKEDARLFYAQRAIMENWGVRNLRQAVTRKEFERNKIALPQLQAGLLPGQENILKTLTFLIF
ncbi:MAG: hypothetical protein JNM14_10380 [Ferruginibacter sp.]|nr:hypothetical protein [Ferruginibacter sp.]